MNHLVWHDYWLERLIGLRRSHLAEWQFLLDLTIQQRRALTQLYKDERLLVCHPIEVAILIQHQMDRILELNRNYETRRQTLKSRQAVEIDNLLQFKLLATRDTLK